MFPWQVGGREMPPDTLSQRYRGKWETGRCHLERFRKDTVASGRQGDATWNAFAVIPCQVGSGEMPPGTLLRGFRARWTAGKDTWHAFAGIPCQVEGKKCHLARFCRNSVPGGQRGKTPGTLLQEFRARWKQGDATWNTFAKIPWQVDDKKCYLEHFRGNSVPGGRQEVTPGTLSQENRARWTAGKDTWNAFAEIPYQVGYLSAGTYCGTPPVLPTMRAPSLLGSRCRLRHLYTPDISQDTGLKL